MAVCNYYLLITKLTIEKSKKKRTVKETSIQALKQASKRRSEETKRKILEAVKKLKERNEEITIYKVSKLSNVSYHSVKKYLPILISQMKKERQG